MPGGWKEITYFIEPENKELKEIIKNERKK